ncbi:hypothetical protein CEXT_674461 [Caerostris extrusa]|uniref:Uncharacterized protein n=1 Tax=Caerostris extrusa TaxID=172846 RepID=A0AAV4S6Z5_CAEEX|nr:hypothetical protein CEXT_674461 [Caerostris extrusa]
MKGRGVTERRGWTELLTDKGGLFDDSLLMPRVWDAVFDLIIIAPYFIRWLVGYVAYIPDSKSDKRCQPKSFIAKHGHDESKDRKILPFCPKVKGTNTRDTVHGSGKM